MRDPKLSEEEIKIELSTLLGWVLSPDHLSISKSFKFSDFRRAFAFMTECALSAEKLDHHPEWTNVYSRVDVRLTTHDSNGLTRRDFQLAQAMDRAAEPRH
jgi:4a-hydroxytetrahydrobiopterin dehydratase